MTFHVNNTELKRTAKRIPTDNRLKPHAAIVDGTFIPFWQRDHFALREAETRLTPKDDPVYAARLAQARHQIAQQKPARNLLLAAVRKRQAA